MGFIAPALPWIMKGASLVGGMLAGKKAQSSAMQRSPEELAALQAATGAGQGLMRQGQTLSETGLPAAKNALSYYGTLLRGDRGAMSLATAGPRAALTDTYRGAERSLEHSGVRGAQKDVASAELSRDRASKISSLITGVQPGAAAALMDGGTNLIGQGNTAMGNAGSLFSGLLGEGYKNRVYGRQEGEKAGKGIGGFLFDILSGGLGKGGGKGGGGGQPGPWAGGYQY